MNSLILRNFNTIIVFLIFFLANITLRGQDSLVVQKITQQDTLQTIDSTQVIDSLAQQSKPIPNRKNYDFQLVNNPKLPFYLAAPEGWVLDNESGKSYGFAAVSYPKGWNLDYSPVLMYANILNGKTSSGNSYKDVVSRQINQLKEYGAEIINDSIAFTYDRRSCIVVQFYDISTKVHNFISYINDRDSIVSLMMTSKDKTKFDEAAPKFFDLINSYKSKTE